MAKHAWQKLEKRTRRLLQINLHADHVEGGTKCVLGGCQIDALGIFGSVALVFECKTTRKRQTINLNHAIDVLAGRRATIRAAIRRKYGKRIKTVRFIVLAHNVTRISTLNRNKPIPSYIRIWTPKYLDAVEGLAKAIGRRALAYILHELGLKNLGRLLGITGRETLPALRVHIKGKSYLYSFFAPARLLLDVGYVARLEEAEGDSYQRLLIRKKLAEVAEYINKEQSFKNSVVISLPKAAKFSVRSKTDVADIGILRLPRVPVSVWIIDGQHRIYGYANAKEKLDSRPLSVVAVQTSNMLDQARIFVDINKNQKPVDSNLLWELYTRLNPDDYTGVVAQLVRSLATSKSSPFYERIYVPGVTSSGRRGYKIYMANICDGIIRYGVLQAALGMTEPGALDSIKLDKIRTAERITNSRFKRFYRALLAICPSMPKPRLITRFLLSNNGVAVFLRVFKETLLFWRSTPSQAALMKYFRKPLKRYFGHADLNNLERSISSEGGRDAAATSILLEVRKEKGLSGFAEEKLKTTKKLIREDEFLRTMRLFEKAMRMLIRQKLSQDCKDWWKVKVPGDVKDAVSQKPEAKQADADLMDLLELNQYLRIISHNWKNQFDWYYETAGKDRSWLSVQFKELSKLRNNVFHFHGATVASEEEIWRVRFLTEDILAPLRKKKPSVVAESATALQEATG